MADVSISGTTHSAQAPPIRRPKLSDSLFFPVLLPIIALILYGLVVVWSASTYTSFASLPRQVAGVVLGVVVAAVIMRYDFRVLANMSTALFVLDIILMLLPSIPGLGVEVNGMTGWIKIPLIGLRYQPSELAKLVTIFLMASVTGQFNGRVETLKDYVRLCGILLVPFILILTQPDLGTGLVILVSGAAIIICGGAKREWVLVTLAIMVAGIALIIYTSMLEDFPVHILKPYQLNRLIVFVDPSVDPTGVGYQLQ